MSQNQIIVNLLAMIDFRDYSLPPLLKILTRDTCIIIISANFLNVSFYLALHAFNPSELSKNNIVVKFTFAFMTDKNTNLSSDSTNRSVKC